MTLAETVRRSARQQNEQRASGLVDKLTQARALEISTAQDVGKALQSVTETLTDLLQRTAQQQSQTEALLHQVQTTAAELRTAAGESTETQAVKLAEVVGAMQLVQSNSAKRMTGLLRQVAEGVESMKAARTEVTGQLAEARTLVYQARQAVDQAARRRMFGPLMMVLATALAMSVFSAWLVSKMTGLPLRWPL